MEIVFVRNGIPGFCKQPALMKKESNALYPIMFFQKAKNATQQDYDAVINFVKQKLESK